MRTAANAQRIGLSRRPRGFTLVEMVITIVVMAIVLAGVSLVFFATVRRSPEPLLNMRAAALGQAYLDEILTKRFDQNSGQGGIPRCNSTDSGALACSTNLGPDVSPTNPPSLETRSQYNDVDDYNGLDESPPRDALGNVLPGYTNYRVQVSVTYAGNGTDGLGLANMQDAKLITVTVTTPTGDKMVFSAYRVNY